MVYLGSEVVLECKGMTEVVWTREDPLDKKLYKTVDNKIIISAARPEHSGLYTCHGQVEDEADQIILGQVSEFDVELYVGGM